MVEVWARYLMLDKGEGFDFGKAIEVDAR